MRCSGWVLALAAACGSHETPFPFSGPDASIDGLPTVTGDAPPGAVTIAVTQHGAPASGCAVFFQDRSSTLLLAASTDANGTAGAAVPAGGYVTVIEPPDGTDIPKLATFGGVQPGDALHLDLPPPGGDASVYVTLTVPTISGAATYEVYTSCGQGAVGTSGTAVVTLLGCGATVDVLVIPRDVQGNALGGLWAPGQRLDVGPIALSGSYQSFVPASFAYADVPNTIGWVETYAAITTDHGTVFSTGGTAQAIGGSATVALAMPDAPGAIGLTVTDGYPAPGAASEEQIFDWGPWGPSYQVDVGSALIRPYTTAPEYSASEHGVTWTEDNGRPYDFARMRLRITRDLGKTWVWSMIGQDTLQGRLVLPVLPASTSFDPIAGDTIAVEELISALVPGGYDAFRPRAFEDVTRMVTGPSGNMVVERMYMPQL